MTLRKRVCAITAHGMSILVAATLTGLLYNTISPVGLLRIPPFAIQENETGAPDLAEGAYGKSGNASTLAPFQPQTITWPEAMDLVHESDVLLLDVRTHTAFSAGSVPGAVSAPVDTFIARVSPLLVRFDVAPTVITFCSNRDCGLARQAAELLRSRFGIERIFYVSGGYEEWLSMKRKP